MSASSRRLRALIRDEGGASALEFALVLPPFLMMLFGVFQLGFALHCASSVRWAVEDAARRMTVAPATSQAELQQLVRDRSVAPDPEAVAVTLETVTDAAGQRLAYVRSTYEHVMIIPLLPPYPLTFGAEAITPIPRT